MLRLTSIAKNRSVNNYIFKGNNLFRCPLMEYKVTFKRVFYGIIHTFFQGSVSLSLRYLRDFSPGFVSLPDQQSKKKHLRGVFLGKKAESDLKCLTKKEIYLFLFRKRNNCRSYSVPSIISHNICTAILQHINTLTKTGKKGLLFSKVIKESSVIDPDFNIFLQRRYKGTNVDLFKKIP